MPDSESPSVCLTNRQRSSVAAWVEDEGHDGTISLEQVGSNDVRVTLVDEDGTPLASTVYTSQGEEMAPPSSAEQEDPQVDSEGEGSSDIATAPEGADEEAARDDLDLAFPSPDGPSSPPPEIPPPDQYGRRMGWGDIASAAGTAIIGLAVWLGFLLLVDVDTNQRDTWTAVLLSVVGVVLAAGSVRPAREATAIARGSIWLTSACFFVSTLALSLVLLD